MFAKGKQDMPTDKRDRETAEMSKTTTRDTTQIINIYGETQQIITGQSETEEITKMTSETTEITLFLYETSEKTLQATRDSRD